MGNKILKKSQKEMMKIMKLVFMNRQLEILRKMLLIYGETYQFLSLQYCMACAMEEVSVVVDACYRPTNSIIMVKSFCSSIDDCPY